MRWAELAMALIMAVFSGYLMWKSAELPYGWIPGEGPGGGAFPFWLAAGMLVCCIWTIVRWVRGTSALSRSTDLDGGLPRAEQLRDRDHDKGGQINKGQRHNMQGLRPQDGVDPPRKAS